LINKEIKLMLCLIKKGCMTYIPLIF
jgi:hypothetical protein